MESVGDGKLKRKFSGTTLAVDVEALRQQFETTKTAEQNRNDFIETLLDHIQSLQNGARDNAKELRAQKMLTNTYQDRFEHVDAQLVSLERAVNCDLFVLVVIDGDNALFNDCYIKDSARGGQRAAQDLYQSLFDYCKDKPYFRHDHKIVIKIFLNLMGLARTYSDAGIISNSTLFQQFIQGFNKMHELMEIVDAGNGMEGGDTKVKATISLFQRNLHCKQIIFAGSGDNSYGSFLRPHAPTSNKSEKITLIETLPFARELHLLSPKFEIVRFDGIFRDTKVAARPVPRQEDLVKMPPSLLTSESDPKRPNIPSTIQPDRASVLASPSADGSEKTPPDERRLSTMNKPSRVIYVDHLGRRIDKPINNVDEELVYRLKQRKLCNRHHLLGYCSFGDRCSHVYGHGPALSPAETESLRWIAQRLPCDRGSECKDPDCFCGHQCQFGTRCTYWQNGNCRFSDEMHKVELSSARVLAVDP